MATMATRLRILHVITRLDLGGSAENTLLTAIGSARLGHETTILCGYSENPPSANEKKAEALGVRIARLRHLVRHISVFSEVLVLGQLWLYMLKHRFDIVHTHTSKAGILGRVAGKCAGVKHIVHTPHGHIFYGYFSSRVTRLFVGLERSTMAVTDALIALTRQEKEDYLARGIGPASKIHPIPSGIDLRPYLDSGAERDSVRGELGLTADCFVVGSVARLVPVKNHHLVVAAASRLAERIPALRFVFVGDGPLREDLVHSAESRGVADRIVFAGWRSDIPQMLSAFDAFVMCSLNEGMGRAFVEAQAAGVPVIGSRVGGVPEVMIEGHTGALVEPDDPDGLAEAITALYNRREELPAIGRQCREWVNPGFSAEAMVARIHEVYQEVSRKSTKTP